MGETTVQYRSKEKGSVEILHQIFLTVLLTVVNDISFIWIHCAQHILVKRLAKTGLIPLSRVRDPLLSRSSRDWLWFRLRRYSSKMHCEMFYVPAHAHLQTQSMNRQVEFRYRGVSGHHPVELVQAHRTKYLWSPRFLCPAKFQRHSFLCRFSVKSCASCSFIKLGGWAFGITL